MIKSSNLFLNIQFLLESLIEEVKVMHKEIMELKNQLDEVSEIINFYKWNIEQDDKNGRNREKISIN